MTPDEKVLIARIIGNIELADDQDAEYNTFNVREIQGLIKILNRLSAPKSQQYISIVEFRGYNRDAFEVFLTDAPLMGHELKLRLEAIVNTAIPKRVFRYTGENILPAGVTQYDGRGEILPPAKKIEIPPLDEKA